MRKTMINTKHCSNTDWTISLYKIDFGEISSLCINTLLASSSKWVLHINFFNLHKIWSFPICTQILFLSDTQISQNTSSQIGLLRTQYVQVYGATTLCTGHTPKCAIFLGLLSSIVPFFFFPDLCECPAFLLFFISGRDLVNCLPCLVFGFFLFVKKSLTN